MDGWEGILPSRKSQRVDPVPTADHILAAAQVSLCRADLRMNENTFQPLSLEPELDIMTEPRRDPWQRSRALVLTLKAWALIWRMDFGRTV
jgi:hypothetical protein